MAQLTDQISGVANSVLIRAATTGAFTDISGYGSAVTVDPQNRMSGAVYTFDGDTAVITYGKREPVKVRVRLVYSEGTPYTTLETAHTAAGGGVLQVQWIPKGDGTTGNYSYTTDEPSKITSLSFPAPDAGSAEPILVEFEVTCPSITRSTVAT